jgi:hypothetical protein
MGPFVYVEMGLLTELFPAGEIITNEPPVALICGHCTLSLRFCVWFSNDGTHQHVDLGARPQIHRGICLVWFRLLRYLSNSCLRGTLPFLDRRWTPAGSSVAILEPRTKTELHGLIVGGRLLGEGV